MPLAPWPEHFDTVIRTYLELEDSEQVTPEMTLSDYGLDSMTIVTLLLELESEFAATIPDEQLMNFVSTDVAGVWALLESAGVTGGDHAAAGGADVRVDG